MRRRYRVILWIAGICTGLLLTVALLAPMLIRRQAVRWVEEHTERTLQIEALRINPLALSLQLRGVRLSGEDGKDLLAFDRLHLALSLRSIYDRSLILRRVTLEGLRLNLVRTAPNHYNFDDLLALAQAGPKKESAPPAEPFHFSVNNIELRDGNILFVDRAVAPEKIHTIADLSLGVPFIGNVPYLADQFVTPRLRATVNGTPMVFEGRLKPFQDGAETLLDLNLTGLDLAAYAAYFPGDLPVRLRSGKLDADLSLGYRVSRERKPEIGFSGKLGLRGLDLAFPDGSALLAFEELRAEFDRSRPLDGEINLAALTLRGPVLDLRRDPAGRWNLQSLVKPAAEAPAAEEKEPFRLRLARLRLENGTVHLHDALPRRGFATSLQHLELDLSGFDNQAAAPAHLAFHGESGRGERFALSGEFTAAPATAALLAETEAIRLEDYYPYLEPVLTAPVQGNAAFKGRLLYDMELGPRLEGGELHLRQLVLPFRPGEALKLGAADLGAIAVEPQARRAAVGAILLDGGRLDFSRDAAGAWSPLALLRSPAAAETGETSAEPAEPPFAWEVGQLDLRSWLINFTDDSRPERALLRLRDLSLEARGIRSAGPSFDRARLALRLGRGSLQLGLADARLQPLRLSGDLRLRQLPLPEFVPYLPANLHLTLADGAADATLAFRLSGTADAPAGTVRGNFGVRNLYAIDSIDADDLLRWESLQCDDLKADLGRSVYSIGGIALSGLTTRIIIGADGQLNFGKVLGPPATAEAAVPAAEPEVVEAAATETAAKPAADIRIGAVTLQNGTIDFVDQRLSPHFRTSMLDLGGRITGLSSAIDTGAELDLRGRLENRSPLRIAGQLNPLSQDPTADIRITFDDIELAPASPYSGRYLGYAVDQGKLSLAIDYKLRNRQIDSRSQIFIDQFTFGQEIDSPDATSLPVRLAVALLKDTKGEIHLDIPVTGRSDDPEFEIWSVVWSILRNLVAKAATSPMALLGSAFGGGDGFSQVEFAPGLAALDEPQRAKLTALAEALRNRPALKLQVSGYAEANTDAEGYRREQLRLKIARAKFLDLSRRNGLPPGALAETMEVSAEERSVYLKEAYRREKFPRPRNVLGMLKDLPDAEMEKLILANVVVGPDELGQLAWARSTAVVQYLAESAGAPKERLFQKRAEAGRPQEAPTDWKGNRVEFGLATE